MDNEGRRRGSRVYKGCVDVVLKVCIVLWRRVHIVKGRWIEFWGHVSLGRGESFEEGR